MLSIGLTGGIAAGKSTVAAAFAAHGAHVLDADRIARDVVEPGTPGLAAVVAAFGEEVLTPAGTLDRPALGRRIFADDDARARLNAIVHPLVAAESARQTAAAAPERIVVHDVPLIVENQLGARYHLVVVVGAPLETRVRRLVRDRGMSEDDARARIAAQADDDARRLAADIWLDNSGPPEQAAADVENLWRSRLLPYERNLRSGERAEQPAPVQIVAPPGGSGSWPVQAARLLARLDRALTEADVRADVAHIGSTAVAGLAAKDVLDLQVGVDDLATARRLDDLLLRAGFPRVPGEWWDTAKPGTPEAGWAKYFHANADPGRAVNLHLRVTGSPGWTYALAFRDWLRADDAARGEYQKLKQELAARHAGDATADGYAAAKEPWFTEVAWPRMEAWRRDTGWMPQV